MKISVVTPAYNCADKVLDTVKSVVDQAYGDLEYILVDGGSTDDTVSVALAGCPEMIVISENDRGIYDAMNKGLTRASGDLIVILNCGDYLMPGALRHLLVQASYGGDVFTFSTAKYDTSANYKVYRRDAWPLKVGQPGVQHPGVVVRRSVYEGVGHFDLGFSVSADYEFLCRVLKRKYRVCSSNFIFTRVEADGFSTDFSNLLRKRVEHFRIFNIYAEGAVPKLKNMMGLLYKTAANLILKSSPVYALSEADIHKENNDFI